MVKQVWTATGSAIMLRHMDAPAVEHEAVAPVKTHALHDVARRHLTANRSGERPRNLVNAEAAVHGLAKACVARAVAK